MARYGLVTDDKKKPVSVFIEDGDGVRGYSFAESTKWETHLLKDVSTLEDALAGGYSYYATEIGEYSGERKAEIDKIIESMKKNDDTFAELDAWRGLK